MSGRRHIIAGAGAVVLVACNSVFGIDDLHYEGEPSDTSGSGGAGASAGSGNSGGSTGGNTSTGGDGGQGGQALLPPAWWDAAYSNRRRIDVDVSDIADDATNVVLYVRVGPDVLAPSAISPSAPEVRFVDGAQQNVLQRELSVVHAEGAAFWVELPIVSQTHDHFWVYYNDGPGAFDDDVFEADFHMVQHFDRLLEDNAIDVVNGIIGTVHNAHLDLGLIGNSVHLDGNSDYVSFPNTAELQPRDGEVRTLSVWFRTSHTGAQPIWIKESGCKGWVASVRPGGLLRGELRTSTNNCGDHQAWAASSSAPNVADDSWHLAALTVDRIRDEILLYVDGTLRGTAPIKSDANAMSGTAYLGTNPFQANADFEGEFDELRISHVRRNEAWFQLAYRNGRGELLDVAPQEDRP